MAEDEAFAPEPPPNLRRRVRIYPTQAWGIPVLFVLPVLAAFDIFGESAKTALVQGEGVSLRVTYPTRIRYKRTTVFRAVVGNSTGVSTSVSLSLSADYVDRFSHSSFSPSPTRITATEYQWDLGTIPPGQASGISGEFHGFDPGKHVGAVQVRTTGAPGPTVQIQTITYP